MRGCPKCGMLINHDDGCKHMLCYGSTTMRHQSITAMHDIEDTVRSRKTPGRSSIMYGSRAEDETTADDVG